jgi:hypothetical protein
VDGGRHHSSRGARGMEPDRYWLLLLAGAAALLAIIVLDRTVL